MIVACCRCYNEPPEIIHRFMKGYWWADKILVSDGGSNNDTVETLLYYQANFGYKIELRYFDQREEINGVVWNPDNPHIQYVIDEAKNLNPDWIVFDDMDDVPNWLLRAEAKEIIEGAGFPQINAFRLYLWGEKEYFPQMNGNFDYNYMSLWAWKPKEVDIHTDMTQHHGTLLGVRNDGITQLAKPYCLLHKSWHPDTIQAKIDKYNAIGIPMNHPLEFAGVPERLPIWAVE